MKKKLLFVLVALLSLPAYASAGCKIAVAAALANECTQQELASHKVNICHVPEGNPENAHTICVDDDSAKNPYNGHFPGDHGGDYLGVCVDPTPTPTATPTKTATPSPTATATATPSPTNTPVNPTPTPSCTPSPTKTATPQPTNSPTPRPTEPPTEGTPTPVPTNTPPQSTPTPEPTNTPVNPTPTPTEPPVVNTPTPTPTATPTTPNVCPLQPTEINKKELLSFARRLKNKAVTYYKKSGYCGNKKFKIQIREVGDLFQLFKEKLEAFPVEVEICGDECVEVVTKDLLKELRTLARAISKNAVKSQHYGKICHNKPGGIANTKPIIDQFNDAINSCPTHVCPEQ